ncbi:MAG: hypothetical protein ACREDR_22940, partial [Blastocatellia bacterium]
MGFHLSWLAVDGKSVEQVLGELGLSADPRVDANPDNPTFTDSLSNGWALLLFNRFDSPWVSEANLRALSAGCTVVACQVEDHVNFSAACYYENGEQKWRVEHDREKALNHLDVQGNLPNEMWAIIDPLKARQELAEARHEFPKIDYICDIPIAIAKSITSFRHHDSPPPAVQPLPSGVQRNPNRRKRRISRPVGVILLTAIDGLFTGLLELILVMVLSNDPSLKISSVDYYVAAGLRIVVVGAALGAFFGENAGRLALLWT